MKHLIYFPAILLFISLSSCDPDMVYDQYIHTENDMWKWQDAKKFQIDISDTISLNNIYIQVRHTIEYPLSNLYMFVHIKGPSGQLLKDTVNFVLADPDGKWKGRGAGNLKELRLLYRKNSKFSQSGTYTFTLEQGMRNPELPITDLGLRIERINPE